MKKLTTPRKGLMFDHGLWLLAVNWSRSWDGWANQNQKKQMTTWKLFTLEFSDSPIGKILHFHCWRLVIRLAKAAHPRENRNEQN